jgi:hypothetical protein
MSEAERHLIRSRLTAGLRHQAVRGELRRLLPPNLIGTERSLGEFDHSVGVSGDHPRADRVVSLWYSRSLSTIHDGLDVIQLPKLRISLNDTRQLALEDS